MKRYAIPRSQQKRPKAWKTATKAELQHWRIEKDLQG
jgi:hypothetical protein